MQFALEAKSLVKQYPEVRAVDDVSFAVKEGTCFGLLGPNGAGKTTTVEMLEGVTPTTSGEIWYYGAPAGSKFREEAGIQFQHTALQDYITVKESLQMFQSLYDRKANLQEIIETCSLGELLNRDNRKLSGGQRQRLLLGIALVNRPRLIFLDEPTTGLDPQARRNFWDLVKRILSTGTTVILTTHYMEEAEILCDDIAIMETGKIIIQGSPASLLKEHYKNVIIEIPVDEISGDLSAIPHKVLETEGIIEIETNDVSDIMRQLEQLTSGLNQLNIRQPNLEDLFLDLTGHSLRA